MRTNVNEILKLNTELRSKWARLEEITTRAKRENRDLSRREAAEVDQVTKDADAIAARLPVVAGRLTQSDERFPDDRNRPDALQPEERVSDWMRERGHLRAGAKIPLKPCADADFSAVQAPHPARRARRRLASTRVIAG